MPEHPNATRPRQFRLPEATLDQLDRIAARHALRSRADVIRFLAKREADRIAADERRGKLAPDP